MAIEIPTAPGFRLDGKRALITGSSRGIGLACAAALGEQGAKLVCLARNQDQLNEAVAGLQAKGYTAQALASDLTDLASLKKLFADQSFDIVVNSAGTARHSAAVTTTPADFDAVMQVNVRAAFFLSSYAAKSMMAAGIKGSIIHISSQMGLVGGIDRAVYCASKHAVEGMIKAMAIEWGSSGIRINSICPTFIRTALTEQTFTNPERMKWILSKIHLRRVGQPQDIMGAVVFLASESAALITGSSLVVDGGWTAE